MLALLALTLVSLQNAEAVRRPVLPADALFTIRDVCGRAVRVRDMDGDGLDDLVIARRARKPDGRSISRPEGDRSLDRIDLMSSKRGARIRTLWSVTDSKTRPTSWEVIGAASGTSAPDLGMLFAASASEKTRIVIVSCETALTRFTVRPEPKDDVFGSTLVPLGDLDADGHADFATWIGSTPAEKGFVCARSGLDGKTLWRARCPDSSDATHIVLHSIADRNADGVLDVLLQGDVSQASTVAILSGKNGAELASFRASGARVSPAGDLDGDGVCDFFEDSIDPQHPNARWESVHLVSGATRAEICKLPYPDLCARYGVTVALGDIDGDGVSDIGLSEPNFNLPGAADPNFSAEDVVDLRKLSLSEAAKLESKPWCAFTWESGSALVYSGRTHALIWGAFACPGSRLGLGLDMTSMPDVDGDGHPDLLVSDEDTAYVFAGPGPAPATK